ncbi:hypothetical protein CAPTEDRAFT_210610 [Capitella teleta]|uniref:Reverse transcriptase domain-containing protein n=1 Tax=Capitella teleta TaxID=283909 RepID=R7V4N8_CAPTE|nr:hypothetical protein CAPTEDRAFT_210610 [Capitella teleta]|eukprot:ELU11326.1 hypothetical protein CAPTEDRAFT_210610 [Capitella teleta]
MAHPEGIDWTSMSDDAIRQYCRDTGMGRTQVYIPHDALLCNNAMCNEESHQKDLQDLYAAIVSCIKSASSSLLTRGTRSGRPGWNMHVNELHGLARDAYVEWKQSGSSRQGHLFELMKATRARFKYALRFIKRNESAMRADSLAMKLTCNNDREFWKEVKMMNNSRTPLPNNIDGYTGSTEACFFVHGFLPEDMLSVVIVPVIKDNAEDTFMTVDNQFGFKPKHGTDMCNYALKEVRHTYNALNSTVFLSFLDASKAFDQINARRQCRERDRGFKNSDSKKAYETLKMLTQTTKPKKTVIENKEEKILMENKEKFVIGRERE